jgi:hypothetical protein
MDGSQLNNTSGVSMINQIIAALAQLISSYNCVFDKITTSNDGNSVKLRVHIRDLMAEDKVLVLDETFNTDTWSVDKVIPKYEQRLQELRHIAPD